MSAAEVEKKRGWRYLVLRVARCGSRAVPMQQIEHRRIRVEEVDWAGIMRFCRLFGAFRMAVHPSKLMVSLVVVTLLYVGGRAMDWLWGPRVYPGELALYSSMSGENFDDWLSQSRADWGSRSGIFQTALTYKVRALQRLVIAVSEMDLGLGQLVEQNRHDPNTVVGALEDLVVVLPGWLLRAHPWFTLVYALWAAPLCAVFCGAVARMAALHATRDQRVSAAGALRFAAGRWVWFLLTPLLPLLLAGVLGLALAGGGLVLFNLPVLEVLGGLLFFLAIGAGLAIACLLALEVAGGHLMYPAVAVEDTDAFDAVSRAFGYVLGRPWRCLFYSFVALAYGAVTFLVVGLVVFMSLWITQRAVGAWVFREVGQVNRFEAMLPPPALGDFAVEPRWAELGASGKAAAGLVWAWVHLTFGLLAAYAVSYYLCASTWVYLLLRRAADECEFDDVALEGADGKGERSAVANANGPDSSDVTDDAEDASGRAVEP